MALVRISDVKPLSEFHVEITLTTGEVVKRDLRPLLRGPVFESLRADEEQFRKVRAEGGNLVWPGEIDLCPDVVIWGLRPAATA
ncbi:MAG: DUF2442 domain-containing protein [Bryobacterales bacterium]|nr:DUF2442 domain-containing protein [Bryobacterales bacterium]